MKVNNTNYYNKEKRITEHDNSNAQKKLPPEAFYGTLHPAVHQEYFHTQSFHHEKPTPPHQS